MSAALQVTDQNPRGAFFPQKGIVPKERASAEAALRASEARYRALFLALDEAVMIIERLPLRPDGLRNWRYVAINPVSQAMFRIGDLTVQSVRDNFPNEDEGWYDIYDRVLETGEIARFEREARAQGIVLQMYAARIEAPERQRIMVVMRDVTARVRAEAALRELNATLKHCAAEALAERRLMTEIFETTDALIQALDTKFRFLVINEASAREYERLYDFRPRVGDNLVEHLATQPDRGENARALWSRAFAGEAFTEFGEFGDPALGWRTYEMMFYPLRSSDGEIVGAYHISREVTERRRDQARLASVQEQLRQAQKMEAIGQLTGGIAHDFNNMLQGVTGALEMAGRRLEQGRSNDVLHYITAAQKAAKRAAGLTRRLLTFARPQQLEPRPVEPNVLVAGMSELLRRTMGPTIALQLPLRAAGVVLCDANELESAVLNLCINARDAMPDGGSLTIASRERRLDASDLRPDEEAGPGDFVEISVQDIGTGMPPEILERVLEPFFTTKSQGHGTGLGLSQVYGFVHQSRGVLRIESGMGRGTTVRLLLPSMSAQSAMANEEVSAPAEAAGPRGAVLLVDDEAGVRGPAAARLRDLGCTVVEAPDGPAALKELENGLHPDLLVTDVGLPNGVDGRAMAETARSRCPGLPVLFITGYAHVALPDDAEVISKPFDLEVLAHRVGNLLANGQ